MNTDLYKLDVLHTVSNLLRFIWTLFMWWCIFSLFKTKQNKDMNLLENLQSISSQAEQAKAGSNKLNNAITVMKQEAKYGNRSATFYGIAPLDESDIEYLKKQGLTVNVNKQAQIVTVSWK